MSAPVETQIVPPSSSNDARSSRLKEWCRNTPVLTLFIKKQDGGGQTTFTSSIGVLFTALGSAVGTGNIWRFSRIMARHADEGGALAFIIAWILFLFLWSIPIIILEYGVGRFTRKSVVESFGTLLGPSYRFMGAFMAIVTFLIASYYSVVLGWCGYYFIISCAYPLPASLVESTGYWEQLQSSVWPIVCHLLAVLASALSVCKGVSTIEPVACVSISVLLIIVVFCFYWAIFLPHASRGIVHIFTPSWGSFKQSSLWLDALSQNAWDTGGGVGTFLTYATYMKRTQGAVKMGVLTPVLNNIVSIVCGIMVFSNVFSVLSQHQYGGMASPVDLLKQSGPASTGITFLWMPILFKGIYGGRFLAAIFFLCLTLAGLSSLISFVELLVHTLTDYGFRRIPATILVTVSISLVGVASAVDLEVLVNQDSVWGYAMILCGCLLVFLVLRLNPFTFRKKFYNEYGIGDWPLPLLWVFIILLVAPIEGLGMIVWWIVEEVYTKPGTWWQFSNDSLAMVLTQWGIVALIVLALNWFIRPLTIEPPKNLTLRRILGLFIQYKELVRPDGVEREEEEEQEEQDGITSVGLVQLSPQNTNVTDNSINESVV